MMTRSQIEAGQRMAYELRADELSSSDTSYLCAKTKGSGKQKPMPYANGKASAKRRSYTLKGSFIKYIVSKYKLRGTEDGQYVYRRKSSLCNHSV